MTDSRDMVDSALAFEPEFDSADGTAETVAADARLVDLEMQIAVLEANLRRLERAMLDGDMRLALSTARADEFEIQLSHRTAELQARDEDLARVVGSRSWALTAPLRRITTTQSPLVRRAMKVTYWALTGQLRQRLRERAAMARGIDPNVVAYRMLQASGLFDYHFYVASYPDVRKRGIDPLAHYINDGAALGYDPNPLFDTSFYCREYQDILADGINPLYHYVTSGADAGCNPNPWFDTSRYAEKYHQSTGPGLTPLAHFLSAPEVVSGIGRVLRDGLSGITWTDYRKQYVQSRFCFILERQYGVTQRSRELDRSSPTIIVAVDDADSGSNTLELVKELVRTCDAEVVVLLMAGSRLRGEFVRVAPTVVVDGANDGQTAPATLDDLCALLSRRGTEAAICTSSATGELAECFKSHGFRVVTTVQELPGGVRMRRASALLQKAFANSDHLVFPSEHVRSHIATEFRLVHGSTHVRSQGLPLANPFLAEPDYARFEVTKQLGLNLDARLVVGCGSMSQQAGFDLFIQMAAAATSLAEEPIHFVWLGESDGVFSEWCQADIQQLGISDRVHTPGHSLHSSLVFAAADVYTLTAREDPLARGCLQAIEAQIPIAAFDASGLMELIRQHALVHTVVPYPNVHAMGMAVAGFIANPHSRPDPRDSAANGLETSLSPYARFLMQLASAPAADSERVMLAHSSVGTNPLTAPQSFGLTAVEAQ